MVAVQNAGAEASMDWVLSHMEDPDFNDPLPGANAAEPTEGSASYKADPEAVSMLSSMGFTEKQVGYRRIFPLMLPL